MNVHWVSAVGVEQHAADDLTSLLARDDGFVWVDIPRWGEQAACILAEVFRFHPLAVRDCREQHHVPKSHAYDDHLFVVLLVPEPDELGHADLVQVAQFVGRRYLVTVHGPLDQRAMLRETRLVLKRLEVRTLRPGTPVQLSYAIVSALARRMVSPVRVVAAKVATVEREVIQRNVKAPEKCLEEMFRLRHELLAVRTVAAQSGS